MLRFSPAELWPDRQTPMTVPRSHRRQQLKDYPYDFPAMLLTGRPETREINDHLAIRRPNEAVAGAGLTRPIHLLGHDRRLHLRLSRGATLPRLVQLLDHERRLHLRASRGAALPRPVHLGAPGGGRRLQLSRGGALVWLTPRHGHGRLHWSGLGEACGVTRFALDSLGESRHSPNPQTRASALR